MVASGNLTGGGRERQGLLRSGSTPREDGGIAEHPVHDEDTASEGELGPDDYEEEFDEARESGFEPRIDDDDEDRASEDEEEA